MEVLLSSFIVGCLAALLGAASNIAISRSLRGKSKEIIIKKLTGAEDLLFVDALATDEQVRRAVRKSLDFESQVYETIKDLEIKHDNLRAHHSRHVDFIAQYNDLRLAIECKLRLDELTEESLNKYLDTEGNLHKLLFFTRKPVKSKILDFIIKSGNQERVSFVTIPDDSELPESVISALKAELHIPQSSQNICLS